MPEPITTIGLGAVSAYLAKDGLNKLLGPTAEYLGQGLKEFTKKRAENIARIFHNAEAKLGDKLNTPGEVPPKVLKVIIDDGSFANDPLAAEYYGGVLASSRTLSGRDDRGARIAKTIDSLSSYQLRTHYLIYATIQALFKDANFSFDLNDIKQMTTFIPYSGYSKAMDFSSKENAISESLYNHIWFGLRNEDLISQTFVYGDHNNIKKVFPCVPPGGGIICGPSTLGVELFLWAFGHADQPLEFLFSPSLNTAHGELPTVIANAAPTATR